MLLFVRSGVGQQGGILCCVVSVGRVVSIVEAASTPWRAAAGLLAFSCDEGVANPWHGADVTRLDAEELASRIEVALRAQGTEGPTFDRAVVVDVVGRGSQGLSPGEVAYATATGLDRVFSSTFTQSWLADKPQVFVLEPGELFPISDMGLMGTSGYSTRPDRLDLPAGELPHVRRLDESGITVRIDARCVASLDGLLAASPLSVAAVVINEDWSELDVPDELFPIAAKDPVTQRDRVKRAVAAALSQGSVVVVVPELCATVGTVEDMEELLDETVGPVVVFAGSSHVVRDSVNANEAHVILPGVGVAWSHDKFVPYETRDRDREGITTSAMPEVTIACGNHVRVAVLICKDVLAPKHAELLGHLGVHLLGVPAMSKGLDDFASAAYTIVGRSQGAMVVANNPRVWEGAVVDTALLGHPVASYQKTDVAHPEATPGFSYGVLGEGWRGSENI